MVDTFPKAFSQVATSQVCHRISVWFLVSSSHSVRSHSRLRRLRRPNLTFGKMPFGILHILEVATWEIVYSESCHLGNCTFGKLPLGKLHIREVATWEIDHSGSFHLGDCPFGKLPLGKLSIREVATWEIDHSGSFHLGNCPFWKLPLGRLHIWDVAFGKMPIAPHIKGGGDIYWPPSEYTIQRIDLLEKLQVPFIVNNPGNL